jgi:large subunit ribosomal protein L24
MKLGIKKGDTVRVLSGKDKAKTGKVLSALPKEGKVIVEGINVVKRATRPSRKMRQAGIMEKPMPMPVAKVMLICARCGRPTRIRRQFREDAGTVRVCYKCNQPVEEAV